MPLTTVQSGMMDSVAQYNGFKNRLINGAMVIDQRNAGASVTANGVYTLDRWVAFNSQTSKYTVQRNAGAVTPPVGFINYLGATSSSAYSVLTGDYFFINQAIEGLNVSDLAWGTASAHTVTLSFQVRSSLTGTFGGALKNGGSNRSYPFTYTISSANTWTTISVTIPGDTSGTWATDNTVGINVQFGLGAGATFSGTAGAWAAGNFVTATGATSVVGTNGATFYVTGVQLEKGVTATSFDYRPYGTELQLCQRYYEKSYPQTTAVPTNASNAGYVACLTSVTVANGNVYGFVKFSVTKRAAAIVVIYSYGSSTISTASTLAGTDLAASSCFVNISSDSAFIVQNTSGAAITPAVGGFLFHYAASAEL
jgi:hypothetical protein